MAIHHRVLSGAEMKRINFGCGTAGLSRARISGISAESRRDDPVEINCQIKRIFELYYKSICYMVIRGGFKRMAGMSLASRCPTSDTM